MASYLAEESGCVAYSPLLNKVTLPKPLVWTWSMKNVALSLQLLWENVKNADA